MSSARYTGRGYRSHVKPIRQFTVLPAQHVLGVDGFHMGAEPEKKVVGRKTIKVGLWGGHGGTSWDDGSYNGVREITLVYDRCIDSIRVEYDKNGKPVVAEKHGGNGGHRTANIKLRYPEEFLTSVSGHYCPVVNGGTAVIRSLIFKSNQRTFGPYGVEEGTPFSFPMDGGLIVGFRGRSGWYLDALGFSVSRPHTSTFFDRVHHQIQKILAPKNGEETPTSKPKTKPKPKTKTKPGKDWTY